MGSERRRRRSTSASAPRPRRAGATADLTAPQRTEISSWRPRGRKGVAVVLAGAAITAGSLYLYARTPNPLPLSPRTVTANGVVGTDLYVGMFAPGNDFRRTLRISGVKVRATSNAPVTITPLLCRRGVVGVTTDPGEFCSELIDPEGERLVGGDSIVLRVRAKTPAIAVVERVSVGYREDLRAATVAAGYRRAIITLAASGS